MSGPWTTPEKQSHVIKYGGIAEHPSGMYHHESLKYPRNGPHPTQHSPAMLSTYKDGSIIIIIIIILTHQSGENPPTKRPNQEDGGKEKTNQ